MSIQRALHFIHAVRNDATLRSKVEALDPDARPEHLVAIGRDAGFDFAPEDLQAAFKHDWAMRRVHITERGPS